MPTYDGRPEPYFDGARRFQQGHDEIAEHERVEDCTLEYQGHVAAPGYGVSYRCTSCGRPWLKIGTSYVDPREQVYELSPEDVI